MLRTVGTALLALGFLALATSVLIRDGSAPDANIGAGLLALGGLPVGTLGLVLVVVGGFRARWGARA